MPSTLPSALASTLALSMLLSLTGCQKPSESPVASADTTSSAPNTTTAPTAQADNATNPTTNPSASANNNSSTPTSATTTATSTPITSTLAADVRQQPITILALGDSLTEGLGVAEADSYPSQLERALHEAGYTGVKVVNAGLSGETSTGTVARLGWVLKTKPDITILTIGANDAMRGIDVATIDNNIRTIIKTLQDNGSVVILGGMQIYDNLGAGYVRSFIDLYPAIAKDTNVTLIPFFLQGVAANAALNQADAIHPTKEGYTLIVRQNVLPTLMPTLDAVLTKKATAIPSAQAGT